MSSFTALREPFWASSDSVAEAFNVLFQDGRFANINPFSEDLDLSERFNVYSRLAIYITAIATIVVGIMGRANRMLLVLIVGAIVVAGLTGLFYYISGNRQHDMPEETAPTRAPVTQRNIDEAKNRREMTSLDYVDNPTQYETPRTRARTAVQSASSEYDPSGQCSGGDSYCMQKLYGSTSEIDQGLFRNPIPDPTLVARPVHFTEDYHPSIVSSEADLASRYLAD